MTARYKDKRFASVMMIQMCSHKLLHLFPLKRVHSLVAATAVAAVTTVGCAQQTMAPNDISGLSVNYDEPSKSYQLNWTASDPSQPVDIVISEQWNFDNSEIISNDLVDSQLRWTPKQEIARLYFKVAPNGKGEAAEASSRWLPLQGGKNFRDLGGYKTTSGQQVRWGKLFRSGEMSELTDDDYLALTKLNIAAVVDFRTQAERTTKPTHWKGPEPKIITGKDGVKVSKFAEMLHQTGIDAAKVEQFMQETYPGILAGHREHYAALFDEMAAGDGAVVFHCTAGKDRTGIASALVLTALGVDRDTVIDDFMLSETYYNSQAGNQQMKEALKKSGEIDPMRQIYASLPAETLAPLKGVRRSYMTATFDTMEAQSGSALAYIQQELDVTDEELAKIRQLYLEPAN